ncbi:MAG: aminoglycoside phosphotransferase family protein [Candidatus Heimdallarchaeota archaeon]|nr:aminoglycoside phosphotransferase family protein [Candidatus Heimdallarchaeota archaeon]
MEYPPYIIKRVFNELEYNVNRVEIASYEVSLNPIYKVELQHRTICVKLHQRHPMGYYNISLEYLMFMRDYLKFLDNQKVMVPEIVTFKGMKMTIWPWVELYRNEDHDPFTLLPDSIPNPDAMKEKYYQLGVVIRKIHDRSNDFDGDDPRSELYLMGIKDRIQIISNMSQSDIFENMSRESFSHLQDLMKQWLQDDRFKYLDSHEMTWIHRDLHPRNYRFDEQGLHSIIDWDHIGFDYAIIDLLILLRTLVRVNKELSISVIKGYFGEQIPYTPEMVEYLLLGLHLSRSCFVIAGGVWKDDALQMEYKLVGNDSLVYELFFDIIQGQS